MFLNRIGQPLILDRQKTYSPYEQHNGPMILTAAAFQDHIVPIDWCACIVGSADDVNRFKGALAEAADTYKYYVLNSYEPTDIIYKDVKWTLSLIPGGQNDYGERSNLYYIQNNDITILIADNVNEYLDFLPRAGTSFHGAVSNGIDVMYVDDKCYNLEDNEALAQREHIYALVQLIRPKFVYGLRSDKLPKCLLDLCSFKDKYALPINMDSNSDAS